MRILDLIEDFPMAKGPLREAAAINILLVKAKDNYLRITRYATNLLCLKNQVIIRKDVWNLFWRIEALCAIAIAGD